MNALSLQSLGLSLGLAFALHATARADTLPPPAALESRLAQAPVEVKVIEPHLSTADRPVTVAYRGWPAEKILDAVLGAGWKAPGVEVEFRALDGYVSRIPSERFSRFRAHLVFERVGHAAFSVDNIAQNEKNVALGPYYLVWDNVRSPELLTEGGTYWPYQVAQVRVSRARKDALLPEGIAPGFEALAGQTQKYCLSCHQVNGYGGDKWPGNLAKQAKAYSRVDFVRWVSEPSAVKPGTRMPGLPAAMPGEEREALAAELFRYLVAVPVAP